MKLRFKILLLIAMMSCFAASAQPGITIGSNEYAFNWSGDLDLGLYFSFSDSRYEFRDRDGNAELWIDPINNDSDFRGDLKVGSKLRVGGDLSTGRVDTSTHTFAAAAVAARRTESPGENVRGYLGVRGTNVFDGTGLNLLNREIGVLGVSEGDGLSNFGVYGISDFTAIYATNPVAANNAAFATTTHAGDFGGDVVVNGDTELDGQLEVSDQSTMDGLLYLRTNKTINISTGTIPNITSGMFQVGNNVGNSVLFDNNELQARNRSSSTIINYTPSDFSINRGGGDVDIADGLIYADDSETKVGINDAFPRTRLEVSHGFGGPENGIAVTNGSSNDSWNLYTQDLSNRLFFYCKRSGFASQLEVSFDCDGGINIISDKRLKEQIEPIGSVIEKVMRLEPKSYYYKHDDIRETRSLGFLAQDLNDIFPDVVSEVVLDENTGETQFMVNYMEFVPLLVSSIQEQQKELDQKDAEISALNSRLDRLEQLIEHVYDEASDKTTLQLQPESALGNNIPNPLTNTTTVNYFLAESQSNVRLVISDLSGKMIREFPITQIGNGQVTIDASEMVDGTYVYSLMSGATVIDSKKMIVTK